MINYVCVLSLFKRGQHKAKDPPPPHMKETLTISDSDSGAVALAGCIARCSVVQEVSFQYNSTGAIGLAHLVHCNSLRRLDLQGNALRNEGAVAITDAAERMHPLSSYWEYYRRRY